jgi:hypothetical protein
MQWHPSGHRTSCQPWMAISTAFMQYMSAYYVPEMAYRIEENGYLIYAVDYFSNQNRRTPA